MFATTHTANKKNKLKKNQDFKMHHYYVKGRNQNPTKRTLIVKYP